MTNLLPYLIPALLFGTTLLIPAYDVEACSAPPPPSARGLVPSAHVIVRAAAAAPASSGQGVTFRVEEILKGEDLPASFIFNGSLRDKDDFNDRPVPYDFVRPRGRGGPCYAYEYKQGAQFLLFLRKRAGAFTPYWSALAPTNEQLRSASDPWLAWVKDHLKWLESASEAERYQLTFQELKKRGLKTDADLLWGYIFIDPDEEKLLRLGKHLESLGYRSLSPFKYEEEYGPNDYVLRVEEVKTHTPASIARRNQELSALAVTFGIKTYGNWVVGKVK